MAVANSDDGRIARSEVEAWDRSADVVIVGLGIAGVCAALEAQAAGADVLVIERAGGGGGASASSEGIFYLGGGTALQTACGYVDSPEAMYTFLRASTSTPADDALRLFCNGAADHFDWLEAHGVPFERRAFTGKAVALRSGEGLLYTGNEKVAPFRDLAAPAPRGHHARAIRDQCGGGAAMTALLGSFAEAGIRAEYNQSVTALVVDSAGRVCGVTTKDLAIAARRAVILATGSFNLNSEMTARYLPVVARIGEPLGIDTNDGSGIIMAEAVGATTRAMDGVIATCSIYPPAELVAGIVVNAAGQRFVAEDAYHGRLAYFIERQPGQRAYLIVDEETFAYPRNGQKLIDAWDSVADMEAALAVPPGSIETTLEEYNADVARNEDRRFGKHPDWLKPLRGRFAAFDLSFDAAHYFYISLGGLETDVNGRAMRADGEPVAGLYAIGACAAHLPQSGAEYASGLSLGPGSFFGRRAGRHSAGAPAR